VLFPKAALHRVTRNPKVDLSWRQQVDALIEATIKDFHPNDDMRVPQY
jgi:hypothetical protein